MKKLLLLALIGFTTIANAQVRTYLIGGAMFLGWFANLGSASGDRFT